MHAIPKRFPFFTKDNASEFARRGNLARWQKPRQLPTPQSEPMPIASQSSQEVSLATRAQIAAIDARLTRAASMDPETLDLLTRSKERLWKILAHAAGIAAPANFKQERKRSGNASIVDLEPVPLPALPDVAQDDAPSPGASTTPSQASPGQSQAQSPASNGDQPPSGPALP